MKKTKFYLILLFFWNTPSPIQARPHDLITLEEADYFLKEFYYANALEVYSYITELFALYAMGSPSADTLRRTAVLSITSSLAKGAFDIVPIARQYQKQKIYPKNIFEAFQQTYYVPLPLFIDAYFLMWGMKKFHHAKNLALFYKENEHIRSLLQETKYRLFKNLILSIILRSFALYTFYYVDNKNDSLVAKRDENTSNILSIYAGIGIFICDIIDVMRKHELHSSQFFHFFEWMKRADYEWMPEEQDSPL